MTIHDTANMHEEFNRLSDMQAGDKFEIMYLAKEWNDAQRTRDIGLYEHVEGRILQKHKSKMLIYTNGTRLAIGNSVAENIYVRPLKR